MTIKDYQEGKVIILSKRLDSRSKVLNLFYFIIFFIGAIFFTYLWISDGGGPGFLIAAFMSIICYIAAFRFGNNCFLTEKLFVTETQLDLIKQGLFTNDKRSFDVTKISNFRHLSKPELTKHPLAGESFDYLGFQTEQQVINEMHGDKRIAFEYEGETIAFGENIYSWDFATLEILLFDITGNDLRYDDETEKSFNVEE